MCRDADSSKMGRSLATSRVGTGAARSFAQLPEVLTPKDLIEYLPLGRDRIYEALKSQAIRNVRVGQKFIITKRALREFLGGAVE